MDPLALATSENEEINSTEERRWENEGGNPGQLQPLLCDDRWDNGITGAARATPKHPATKVNRTCT